MDADELLIDELAGRTEAERRKLHVTGNLGVHAYVAGFIDFDQALARLRSTNFRLSAEVERLVRRDALPCPIHYPSPLIAHRGYYRIRHARGLELRQIAGLQREAPDRKSVVQGKSVDLGGRRIIKK